MILPDKFTAISKLPPLDTKKIINKDDLLILCTAQTVDVPVQHSANLSYGTLMTDIVAAINQIFSPYVVQISKIDALSQILVNFGEDINRIQDDLNAINYTLASYNARITALEEKVAFNQYKNRGNS